MENMRAFVQVDSSDPGQRNTIYNAAMVSLFNLNKAVSSETKQIRNAALSRAINALEEKYIVSKIKLDTTALSEMKINDLVEKNPKSIRNRFYIKYLVALCFMIIAVIIVAKELISTNDNTVILQDGQVFRFPLKLSLENNAQTALKVRGLGKLDQTKLPDQIVYSVGRTRKDKHEFLDINING